MVTQVIVLKCKECGNNFDTTATYNEHGQMMPFPQLYCDYCDYERKYGKKQSVVKEEELTIDTSNWDKVTCTDNAPTLFEPINKYTITLNKEGNDMGKLDLNGDKLKFEGYVEESAKLFIDYLLNVFNERIEEIKKESYKEGYSDAEWHNQAP